MESDSVRHTIHEIIEATYCTVGEVKLRSVAELILGHYAVSTRFAENYICFHHLGTLLFYELSVEVNAHVRKSAFIRDIDSDEVGKHGIVVGKISRSCTGRRVGDRAGDQSAVTIRRKSRLKRLSERLDLVGNRIVNLYRDLYNRCCRIG